MFFFIHGMVVEKLQGVISLKYSRWLKPHIDFITNKRAAARIDFAKDLPKSMNPTFYGKTKENVENILKKELIKKDDYDKMVKVQSKGTFNGIHKSYEE